MEVDDTATVVDVLKDPTTEGVKPMEPNEGAGLGDAFGVFVE